MRTGARASWAVVALVAGGGLAVGLSVARRGDPAPASPVDLSPVAPVAPTSRLPEPPAGPVLPGATRTVLDLVAHPERIRRVADAGARRYDLGTGDGAGLHLGGWQTGTGVRRVVLEGGRAVSVVPGVVGKLVLPPDLPVTQDVVVSILGAVPGGRGTGEATVYVDDETVAYVRFPPEGAFGLVSARISAARLAGPRPHLLALRVPRTGEVPGFGRAGLLLDRLTLTPAPPLEDGHDDRDGAQVPDDPVPATPDLSPWPPLRDGTAVVMPAAGRVAVDVSLDPESSSFLVADGSSGAPDALVVRASLEGDPAGGPPVAVRTGGDGSLAWALPGRRGTLTTVVVEAPPGTRLEGLRVAAPEEAPAAAPRPRTWRNLVVILCDTLRADALRAYAPESRVRTPALDGLVRTAATFGSARAQENWTKPSVATLLTGLFPWEHRAQDGDSVVPDSALLLSERLREAGFHTGAFIANGYVSGKFGFERGWTTWRNYIREGRRTPARFVAGDVLAWLDARPEEDPFFLYVHTIDPHVPYIVPDEDLAAYDADPYEGPVDFTKDRLLLEKVKTGRIALNDRDRVRLRALYDAEISYHDHHLATILEALERRGLADDTMVVFTSDHGEEFFEHGSVGHGHSVYDELLRVPLFVRLPGLTDAGVEISGGAGLVDVVPTIFEALGLAVPDGMSGSSLLPRLRGEAPDAPPVTISAFMNGWRAVVEGDLKLALRTLSEVRLYDLGTDPGETRNLAAERPVAVAHLRRLLGQALTGEVQHRAGETEIDPATAAQLRALGYTADFRTD